MITLQVTQLYWFVRVTFVESKISLYCWKMSWPCIPGPIVLTDPFAIVRIVQYDYDQYPIGSMYATYGNIYHQYTPVMLAYIPAPWIRHGYGAVQVMNPSHHPVVTDDEFQIFQPVTTGDTHHDLMGQWAPQIPRIFTWSLADVHQQLNVVWEVISWFGLCKTELMFGGIIPSSANVGS